VARRRGGESRQRGGEWGTTRVSDGVAGELVDHLEQLPHPDRLRDVGARSGGEQRLGLPPGRVGRSNEVTHARIVVCDEDAPDVRRFRPKSLANTKAWSPEARNLGRRRMGDCRAVTDGG
jgi:hypothetical protein